jgi:hypothetical protein
MIHCNDPRHDEIEAWYRQALEACGAAPQSERPANYDTDVIEAALDDRDRAVPQSEREGLDANYSQMRTVYAGRSMTAATLTGRPLTAEPMACHGRVTLTRFVPLSPLPHIPTRSNARDAWP